NVDLIMKKYNGKKITILGITYKGNIDDIRESPALKIIDKLKKNTNYQITLFDPYISDETIEPNFDFAITDSDLIIILADHDDFKNITEKDLSKMKQKIIFDTKNIVDLTLKDGEVYNLGNLYSIETNEDV
uniref:UDP-glucose/GDP-mannose dehydrogenase family protein n=1 Tax=Enterococcus faecium TaxID=1352 RepID=UPI0023B23A76